MEQKTWTKTIECKNGVFFLEIKFAVLRREEGSSLLG